MSLFLQISIAIFSIGTLILVWTLTKRNFFRPAYAILWLIVTSIIAGLSIFPKPLILLTDFFKLSDPSILYLAMGLSFITILLTQLTVVLSSWTRKSKELAQEIAILKWQVEKLEKAQELQDQTIANEKKNKQG